MHDLVIRRGHLIDGSGAPGRRADLAIDGDRITEISDCAGPGRREIDARGAIVTPGWVDVHTHYDAQVTWDPEVGPSSWHGVTTAVMGNCGVGFAPVAPERREWLIQLMEGVEDIPGAAMSEGIRWAWESFPEYLDALEATPRAIDIAAQVPHAAVRAHVMGERGAANEPATADDVARMAAIVEEGLRAGAVGFSTSRTLLHKGADGEYVPGTFAAADELLGIGRALGRAGHGVFQMTSNHHEMPAELDWMYRLAAETGRTVCFNLVQFDQAPDLWRQMLGALEKAAAEGVPLRAEVAGRPAGILMGWDTTAHPFARHAAFAEVADLPPRQRVEALRQPERRARLIADAPETSDPIELFITSSFHKMFRLAACPDYEPETSTSAAAEAERRGVSPRQVAYEWLMEENGEALIYFPIFNYSAGNMDQLREMLRHPQTRIGLSDGGAHVATICDSSIPTYMLTHWARDRKRGTIDLEEVVAIQTSQTAELYGFTDRGLLRPGMRADVNVIDLERLELESPRMTYDLPAGGKRLLQRARGYLYTLCAGEVTFEDGQATGARPGRLVRGGAAPAPRATRAGAR